MKQSGSGGCLALVGIAIAVLVVLFVVQVIAAHPSQTLALVLLVGGTLTAASVYGKRSQRERAQRRAAVSLRVEAARTGAERRLWIAQELMRLAAHALEAAPLQPEPRPWSQPLQELAAEAEQLRRSAVDPLGSRMPESGARDGIDETVLLDAIEAL